MLDGLRIVLVDTRFPENIGMVARACANMGCNSLHLVRPERLDIEKARPLATPKGVPVLHTLTVHERTEDALADTHYVLGTTARQGGWRAHCIHPKIAAQKVCERLRCGESVALLFGPEDRGLDNTHIRLCHDLTTIPTDTASSLNLAQAVLLILYECAEELRSGPSQTEARKTITQNELATFFAHFKDALLRLDCLHGDNVDYFFLPWQRLFARAHLSRREYDALMGLCRQIRRITAKSPHTRQS